MNKAWAWGLAAVGALVGGYSLKRWLTVEVPSPVDRSRLRVEAGPGSAESSRGESAQAAGNRERRADADPQALAAAEAGSDRIGFDLEQLKNASGEFEPLVEHLAYIQVKRGEQQSLIFVRKRDLDTLAALTGMSKDNFVEEFQQLGVMISMN